MTNKKWLSKCFSIDNGIKVKEPSENISKNYLLQAQNTLKNIRRDIDEKDFLWSSVKIYYSAYYTLYAFLQRIGVSCENHSCSIELFKYLIENDELSDMIEKFKKERIDAQYYLKFSIQEDFMLNYNNLKFFYLKVSNLIYELDDDKIKVFIQKVNEIGGDKK